MTIHRGSHQIGGTCIEVATSNTRIILDVGQPLGDPDAPAKKDQNKDLPQVPGLFEDLFEEGPKVDAVVLSHAHGDHTGLLRWVRKEIPVYLSRGTSKMLMAGSIFAGQHKLARARQRTLRPLQPTRIGDITITGFPVDHSAFDSLAFLIEADGKRLLYSGDLRMHGRKPGMAAQLIRHISSRPVDLMLMEGTNIARPQRTGSSTENEVQEHFHKTMQACPSLVLANFSPMHVDRMVSFYKAARKANREFVVDVYGAFVLHLASGQCKIPKPTRRNQIAVYYNQSFERTWEMRNLGKVREMFLGDHIELSEVLAEPEAYVMMFRPSMLKPDFGNSLPEHTYCIYSYWSGYLKQPQYTRLREKLAGVSGELLEIHTSGHISRPDAIEFVQAIAPHKVAPIHTETPDEFLSCFPNAIIIPDGQPHVVDQA
ncbi:MAG TPA: MBL fold metallo-hydrolase [Verrucomicrobiae bacterium]|nr:MBL fold metallo-hydrolase [Verrucomicrobiae bacterium]